MDTRGMSTRGGGTFKNMLTFVLFVSVVVLAYRYSHLRALFEHEVAMRAERTFVLQSAQEEASGLKRQVQDSEDARKQCEATQEKQLKDKDSRIKDLETERDNNRNKVKDVEKKRDELQGKVDALTKEKDAAQSDVNAQREEKEAKNAEIEGLKKERDEAKKKLEEAEKWKKEHEAEEAKAKAAEEKPAAEEKKVDSQ